MERVNLRDITSKLQSGDGIKAGKIFEEGLFPVFGGNGLRGYTDTFNQDGEYFFIGRQGAKCGNVHYNIGKAFMTEHAVVGCPKEGYDAVYLAYKLSLLDLGKLQGQSAQPGLAVGTLADVELEIPEYRTQHDIGKLLYNIDQKISLNTRMNAELEAMAKQLYDYWFVQFDFPFDFAQGKPDENGKPYKSSGGKMVWNEKLKREIPEGWEVVELRSILDNMVQGTLPGNHLRDLPYCPIDEIPIRRMSFAGGKSWEEAQSSLQLYEKKNILIGAMRVYFHRCCISSCPGITRTTTIVLTPRKEEYLSYCYQVCNEERTFEFAIKESNGTQQPYVTWNSLSKFILPYPKDDRIIKQYCEQTSMIVDLVLSNEIQCDRLTRLRDSLLPMLMNGQVTIE